MDTHNIPIMYSFIIFLNSKMYEINIKDDIINISQYYWKHLGKEETRNGNKGNLPHGEEWKNKSPKT